jgi:hypothetical protein
MLIKDRIKDLRRVPSKELLPNPTNWRDNPDAQANALWRLLEEVGFVNSVLARETPAGLQLIDGHPRGETASGAIIPVWLRGANDGATVHPCCRGQLEVLNLRRFSRGIGGETVRRYGSLVIRDEVARQPQGGEIR